MCQPRLRQCSVQAGWAKFIALSSAIQPFAGLVCALFAFIGTGIAFFKKGRYFKILVILFAGLYVSQAALEVKEGRFLIPLYPFYALFIPIALSSIATKLRLKRVQ